MLTFLLFLIIKIMLTNMRVKHIMIIYSYAYIRIQQMKCYIREDSDDKWIS